MTSTVQDLQHHTRETRLVAKKAGYLKVKLFYTTEEPKHIRSYVMQHTYNFKPPFVEDVCILLPQSQVIPTVTHFSPYITQLQLDDILSTTAKLNNFQLMDEDDFTLAYVLN